MAHTQTHDPIDILRDLIAIPSLNPEDTVREEWIGEARMAEWLTSRLSAVGISAETHEVLAGRPNVIFRLGADKPGRTLMIEGHMDTVSVEGMTVDPFKMEERDGKLYGRGACDTKGPTAAALAAILNNAEAIAASGHQVIYVAAVAEEKGCVGAAQLTEFGLGADEAIILEPTNCHPVIGHKGNSWFELEAHGRSVHAANPQLGSNAIEHMCHAIQALKAYQQEREGRVSHPLFTPPTMSVDMISGGKGVNVVPDSCIAQIDCRMLPGEDADQLRTEITARLDELEADYTFRLLQSGTPFITDADSPLVQGLVDCARAEGHEAKPYGTGWFSDAGYLAANCGATVVFGPGDIAQAHTADEFIEVEELTRGTRILERYLKAFLAG